MARRHIETLIDRKAINDINDNFKELFDEYVGAGMDAAEARELAEQAVANSLSAKEDASEAREIVQQIMDGSFDMGALNTNIEQKLNELETEYAPKLSTVSQQLAKIVEDMEQLGTTTFTRVNGQVSEITSPTKAISISRDIEGVVQSVAETNHSGTIKTSLVRDEQGVIQSINRERV